MFRTDVSTAAPTLPTPAAAGSPGYFTNGSPTVAATVVDADWLNGIQEELISILSAASLVPSKATHNQVLTALQGLFGQLGEANSWAGVQTFEAGLVATGGTIAAATPSGGAGGFQLLANATTGKALFQVLDPTAHTEWGYWQYVSSGAATYTGALSVSGAFTASAGLSTPQISGLTTPLSLAQGGTGANSAAGARGNLGVTATGADATYAFRSNNLSDLASAAAARINLGVTATGQDATYCSRANNLADLPNIPGARNNLGLGALATLSSVANANLASAPSYTFKGNGLTSAAAPYDMTPQEALATLGFADAGNSTTGSATYPSPNGGVMEIRNWGLVSIGPTTSATFAYSTKYEYDGIPTISVYYAGGSVAINNQPYISGRSNDGFTVYNPSSFTLQLTYSASGR